MTSTCLASDVIQVWINSSPSNHCISHFKAQLAQIFFIQHRICMYWIKGILCGYAIPLIVAYLLYITMLEILLCKFVAINNYELQFNWTAGLLITIRWYMIKLFFLHNKNINSMYISCLSLQYHNFMANHLAIWFRPGCGLTACVEIEDVAVWLRVIDFNQLIS